MALAVNYLNRWTGEGDETMVEAKRHADEAIALEPELAFVHSARALVALMTVMAIGWRMKPKLRSA